MAGIGKTQVAIQYVYKYWNEYDVVLWIGAVSDEKLAGGF